MGGEVNMDEIVEYPIHIQETLQPLRRFGIGIGFPSKGRRLASQRTEKGFSMVGMNLFLFDRWFGVGMLVPGRLILGTLGSFLVGLRALVLDPHFHPFLQRLLRTARFAITDQFPTELKQQVAIAPFPIGQQGQIRTVLDDLFQRLDGFLEEFSAWFKPG